MFTVIIPTYNCADYIQRCIDSILSQDIEHSPVHIVVVDDASTDHTKQIMQMYVDEVNYVVMPNRYGANVARNQGFKVASQFYPDDQYVLFCDADCNYKPNYISTLFEALQTKPEAPFSYSDHYVAYPNDQIKEHISGEFSMRRLSMYNFIDTSSALLRRSAVIDFDQSLRRLQDWDFFLGVCKKAEAQPVYIQRALYFNNQRDGSISSLESYEDALIYVKKKHNI